MIEEQKLREWVKNNKRKISYGHGKIDIIGIEVLLLSPSKVLSEGLFLKEKKVKTGRFIGVIDYIFKYRQTIYICEAKCYSLNKRQSFWNSLKVLGYTAYYNWSNNTKYEPALLLPKKYLRLEHFIVANKLKIKIFGYTKIKEGDYLIKELKCPKKI